MTTNPYDFSLATSLAMLKEMIVRALEDDSVPKHSAAVIDRMTDYKAEEKRVSR